jgi:hypothetical protein
MKRGTPDHWKMKDFARRAGAGLIRQPYALAWANGVLERLWHYAAKYCPQGDIGRVPDEEIAEVCCWPRARAGELVQHLLASGWLDSSEKHRLLIHDWKDHCESSVKKTLQNRHLEFFFPESSGKSFPFSACLSLSLSHSHSQADAVQERSCPSDPTDDTQLGPVPANGRGHPELAPTAELNGFTALRDAVEAASPPDAFTPDDWAVAYRSWLKLDMGQRVTAQQNYLDRIAAGENLTFLKPQFILRNTEWRRRPAPARRGPPTADEILRNRADRRAKGELV